MFHAVTLDPIGFYALVIGCMLTGMVLYAFALVLSEFIEAKIQTKRLIKRETQAKKGL